MRCRRLIIIYWKLIFERIIEIKGVWEWKKMERDGQVEVMIGKKERNEKMELKMELRRIK